MVNNTEITDPTIISKEVHNFYSDLYLSNFLQKTVMTSLKKFVILFLGLTMN